MSESVQIIGDSISPNGYRFTTFLIKFPKCLLAELNTHRTLVRNVGSSRAIPVQTVLDNVKSDPFIPTFTANQKGMVGVNNLSLTDLNSATISWLDARDKAIEYAEQLKNLNIHKGAVNRLLEPFMYSWVVLSGTEVYFNHFFSLRDSELAHDDFRAIAATMREKYSASVPIELSFGQWHIPFGDNIPENLLFTDKLKVAIARIARVSYHNHSGTTSVASDIALADFLYQNKHLTPMEHCAMAVNVKVDDETTKAAKMYLPEYLQPFFFMDRKKNKLVFTRQYEGFYTYRNMVEDNYNGLLYEQHK